LAATGPSSTSPSRTSPSRTDPKEEKKEVVADLAELNLAELKGKKYAFMGIITARKPRYFRR
jgi:hypothetical protein